MSAFLVAGVAILGGCASSAPIPAVPLASSPACDTFWTALPDNLDGWGRVGSSRNPALFRDPTDASAKTAVEVWCGLDRLAATSDPCAAINDIDWVLRDESDWLLAATFGRKPAIQVNVPVRPNAIRSHYLVDLAPAAATLPRVKGCL